MRYDPKKIEAKWQKKWLAQKTYEPDFERAKNPAFAKASAGKPFYNLMMFPYPSAEGLHVGNMYAFTGSDIYGRLKRMQGYDVFEPIGLDGFGIHSENYAIKIGVHPMKQAVVSEKNFYRQLAMIGNGFAWREHLETYDPEYYKWTQWIFVTMFKQGLAYRKKQAVNWCPSCKTVLADEQVIAGKCERCGSMVIKKELEQWFFRITKYAPQLLKNLETLDWSERVKIAQREWIGESEGAEIEFRIKNSESRIKVFTTRPDTLFGATYLVVAPEHALLRNKELGIKNQGDVDEYIKEASARAEADRIAEGREKTGIELKGIKAINPANDEEIPIFVADYVLAGYGTGAIMAVPAHDTRDLEFAKKYGIPERTVIVPKNMKCVLVHGCPSKPEERVDVTKASDKHWIPWMREQMQKNKIQVFTPLMPEPWKPDYAVWKKEFEKIPVDEHTVVVGHSCGGAFLVRWLGETQRKVKKLILLAGAKIPADDANEVIRNLYDFDIDPRIRDNVGEIAILISDDDEDRHRKSATMYVEALHGKIMKFKGKGHFLFKQMGTNAFPELFDEILKTTDAYTEGGTAVNSGKFSGMDWRAAKGEITKSVHGKLVTTYHLRDWLISRQRYWAPPIPMIFCDACAAAQRGERPEMHGWYTAPVKTLPVKLPFIKNFRPTGSDQSPLAGVVKFYRVRCPGCRAWARRETDVSDTFLDSAWYYLRYPSVGDKKSAWNPTITKKWLPVTRYMGGAEHSVLHLLYVRFLAMALHDAGLVHFDEPMPTFRAHGLIIKDGAKMSKSKGNIINPDEYIRAYGADALRMYLMFLAPWEQGGDFRDAGIKGITRFLERAWKFADAKLQSPNTSQVLNPDVQMLVHKTMKKVGEDIENLQYNTAISSLMILLNAFEKSSNAVSMEDIKVFLKLLAPFAPHMTEDLWQRHRPTTYNLQPTTFRSIHREPWPEYDPRLIHEAIFDLIIQVDGKTRFVLEVKKGISQDEAIQIAQKTEIVSRHLSVGHKKVIFVPDRLINFVT